MSPPPSQVAAIQLRLDEVRARVAAACSRAGRDPAGVAILPVSKAVGVDTLRAAQLAGLDVFAENRVQEAEAKAAALPAVRWELVGHLQSNKAARAVGLFSAIHSVDSVELARRLNGLLHDAGRPALPVYVQVNVDRDPHKSGMLPEQLEVGLPELAELSGLELRGLMTVGRLTVNAEQARSTFAALRVLRDRLAPHHPFLGRGLSMGMSDDFEVAVEEGATVVRVGRALFGDRLAG